MERIGSVQELEETFILSLEMAETFKSILEVVTMSKFLLPVMSLTQENSFFKSENESITL